MDVSGIKSAQLAVSGVLAGEIDDTEKSKVINRQEDTSHSEKIIEELGERYNRENTKITKPQLNGKPAGKQHDDKISAKKISISELFSLLSDNLSGEQIKSSGINQSINNNIMKNIWSEKKNLTYLKTLIITPVFFLAVLTSYQSVIFLSLIIVMRCLMISYYSSRKIKI